MERNIKIFTVASLAFLCILSLSGSLGGVIGEILYILAFAIPVCLSLLGARGEKPSLGLGVKIKNAALIFSASPLLLFLIFALSFITAVIISITVGANNPSPVSGSPVTDVLSLAFAPAILEEALFRYLPLKLIAPYSRKSALIISSLFFSLVHASLFSIPHALLAGFGFMAADLIAGSVIPSVVLHFLNNLISIGWEYSVMSKNTAVFLTVFIIFAAISILSVILMRKKFKAAFSECFDKKDKVFFPTFTAALIIPTLAVAILNLFYK